MENSQLIIPQKYNVYMQDLDKDYIELTLLGFVKTIGEARTMVKLFREALAQQHKNASVFFQLDEVIQ